MTCPVNIIAKNQSAMTANAVAQQPSVTTAAPPIYVQCPHPHDVLMPLNGYQLWAGNCRYMKAINQRKEAFSKADLEGQARIAQDVLRYIQREQHPAGRFLIAIDVPIPAQNNPKKKGRGGIISATVWQTLQEPAILYQLGKHLRETRMEKKRRKKHKRNEKKKKKKRKQEVQEETIPISKLDDALQSLYYVPNSYGPTPNAQSLSSPEESSSSSESSSEEEEEPTSPPPQPKPKKPRSPPKPKAVAPEPAPVAPKQPIHNKPKPKPQKLQPPAPAPRAIPKGVTARPSGKWVRLLFCLHEWLHLQYSIVPCAFLDFGYSNDSRCTLLFFISNSKPRFTFRAGRVTWEYSRIAKSLVMPTLLSRTIYTSTVRRKSVAKRPSRFLNALAMQQMKL